MTQTEVSAKPGFTTGNTVVTTERLMQIVTAINTNKMFAKDLTKQLAVQKKELFGSELPAIAFQALWRMRGLSDQERQLIVKAVTDFERHLNRNEFKALESLDGERLQASKDVREAKRSAKELGVNTRALDVVLKFGDLDEIEREELFHDIDKYGAALRYW